MASLSVYTFESTGNSAGVCRKIIINVQGLLRVRDGMA